MRSQERAFHEKGLQEGCQKCFHLVSNIFHGRDTVRSARISGKSNSIQFLNSGQVHIVNSRIIKTEIWRPVFILSWIYIFFQFSPRKRIERLKTEISRAVKKSLGRVLKERKMGGGEKETKKGG